MNDRMSSHQNYCCAQQHNTNVDTQKVLRHILYVVFPLHIHMSSPFIIPYFIQCNVWLDPRTRRRKAGILPNIPELLNYLEEYSPSSFIPFCTLWGEQWFLSMDPPPPQPNSRHELEGITKFHQFAPFYCFSLNYNCNFISQPDGSLFILRWICSLQNVNKTSFHPLSLSTSIYL